MSQHSLNFCCLSSWGVVMVVLINVGAKRPASRAALHVVPGLYLLGARVFQKEKKKKRKNYSRASGLNLVCACRMSGLHVRKTGFARVLIFVLSALAAGLCAPSRRANRPQLRCRLLGSFMFFRSSPPDTVLSGRPLGHWAVLSDFLAKFPVVRRVGVGYKTLPFTVLREHGHSRENKFRTLGRDRVVGPSGVIASTSSSASLLDRRASPGPGAVVSWIGLSVSGAAKSVSNAVR